MKLVLSDDIRRIDDYAETVLQIPKTELMARSGEAVAEAVRARIPLGASVVILAGKGNNGGDGYASAALLSDSYDVIVFDIFSSGQLSEEGKHHLARAEAAGVSILPYTESIPEIEKICLADCIVDAIFGTGFHGALPENVKRLADKIQTARQPFKIAIDVPLGVNADNGTALDSYIRADVTVVLSYMKVGLLSYPARELVGELVHTTLGLPDDVENAFLARHFLVDGEYARTHLPMRKSNSSKGSFGKLSIYAGSERYRGAAALALGAALRSGVGLCEYKGPSSLCEALCTVYPEAIYKSFDSPQEIAALVTLDARFSATLIGCGSDTDAKTAQLVREMLSKDGAPLILDADAINVLALAAEEGRLSIKTSKRTVILTPHPLEFARLLGIGVDEVQKNRIELARAFAKEYGVIIVLKGAATLITDGEFLFVNATGSSALAKAGSGDVLAGALSSLVAMGTEPLIACAIAVYVHGLAADRLCVKYSSFGVTPSDLPLEMARVLAELEEQRKQK